MIDLVVVGKMFSYMEDSLKGQDVNIIEEPFTFETGYNYALNRGAEKGDAEYIGFCNNDLEFNDKSIPFLKSALDKYYDSVSPWCPLTHLDWWDKSPNTTFEGYQVGKVLAGWCYFMKRSAYEKIGGFDERIKFWASDNATAHQFGKNRIKHALIPYSLVKHRQSQTLNRLPPHLYRKLTLEQTRLFQELYGYSCFDKRYNK